MIAASEVQSIGAARRGGSALKKALTVLVIVALLTGTLSFVTAGSSPPDFAAKAEQRPASLVAGPAPTPAPDYAAAYRLNRQIIVVPPPQPRRTPLVRNVGPDRGVNAYAMVPSDDAALLPKPPSEQKPQQSRPRWPLRSQTPDLAAAPLADGPTPVRPTPRFGFRTIRAERFGTAREVPAAPRLQRAAMRTD